VCSTRLPDHGLDFSDKQAGRLFLLCGVATGLTSAAAMPEAVLLFIIEVTEGERACLEDPDCFERSELSG
jgi:H+/Cl- antiporter ClcA